MNNSSNLFGFYLGQAQSKVTLEAFWKKLLEEKIIAIEGSLGSGSAKAKLATVVSQSPRQAEMPKIYSAVSVELSEIYKDKKRNANRIFIISIIVSAIGIILLLTGFSISFLHKDAGQTGIVTSASGIITTFLSGTFFWLYKRENAKLTAIENDIKKIKVLEGFAAIASGMQKDDAIIAAYQQIITQMNL